MKHNRKGMRTTWTRRGGLLGRLLGVFLLAGFLAGTSTVADAAVIPTGPTPVDTVILPDGSTGAALNAGNSTVTILDAQTQTPISTIPLLQPPGVCRDMDWHQPTQRLHVGCTTGLVLWVDPVLGTSGTLVTNVVANYSVIASDNQNPMVLGWGIDVNSNWLEAFLPGGVVVPIAPLFVGTPVELVEKRVDPLARFQWMATCSRWGPRRGRRRCRCTTGGRRRCWRRSRTGWRRGRRRGSRRRKGARRTCRRRCRGAGAGTSCTWTSR